MFSPVGGGGGAQEISAEKKFPRHVVVGDAGELRVSAAGLLKVGPSSLLPIMDMDTTRSKRESPRSLTIMKPKSSITSHVGLGRTFFLSPKLCTSCVQPLGLFLSRGSNCPKCGLKVCKKCKVFKDNFLNWNCLVCSKDSLNYMNKSITIGGNSKKYRDTYTSSIKRSWSISATSRGSPILKAYTKYSGDHERGYNSLPRMSTESQGQNNQIQGGGHFYAHPGMRPKTTTTIARLEDLNTPFPSTLHPFMTNEEHPSPSSSINFIEDEYWDYYDYEINSNRSSCERSLGESVEYTYQHIPESLPPKKPIRTKGRSRSMGSYDTNNPKYSQLKTYCVVNATPSVHVTPEPRPSSPITSTTPSYSSQPFRKKRSNSLGKENIKIGNQFPQHEHPHQENENSEIFPRNSRIKEHPIKMRLLDEETFASHSLPRKIRKDNNYYSSLRTTDEDNNIERRWPLNYNTSNTLPKEWKIFKRRDNNATTIVITGVNCPPNPSDSAMSLSMHRLSSLYGGGTQSQKSIRTSNLSRTYISDAKEAMLTEAPKYHPPQKFPIKEPYPSFPNKIQPFHDGHRELRPLLPLYRGLDTRHGLFVLSSSSSHASGEIANSTDPTIITTTNLFNSQLSDNLSSLSSSSTLRGDNGPGKRNFGPCSSPSVSRSSTSIQNTNNSSGREVIITIQRESESSANTSQDNGTNNFKTNSLGGDSLGTIEPISVTPSRNIKTIEFEKRKSEKSLLVMDERQGLTFGDPITNGSEAEENYFSDSSFHSIMSPWENDSSVRSNNASEALGDKMFRGEDKDDFQFESCNVSSEEDYDEVLQLRDDDEQEGGGNGSAPEEPFIPHTSTAPEIFSHPIVEEYVGMIVGLSDQRVQKIKPKTRSTSSLSSGEDNEDGITLQRIGNTTTTDDECSATNEKYNNGSEIEITSSGMSTSQLTNPHPQNRRYKSRVLIGVLEDQTTTVQVSGDSEVEIVISEGTFFHDFDLGTTTTTTTSTPLSTSENEGQDGGDLIPRINTTTTSSNATQVQVISKHRTEDEHKTLQILDTRNEKYSGKNSKMPLANSYRRESPEGEESINEEKKTEQGSLVLDSEKITSDSPLPAPSRYSPDGADAEKSEDSSSHTPTSVLEMNSEDCKSESTDSWTEEVTFLDESDERPAPLDMTLHTICEESETESEHKTTPNNTMRQIDSQRQGLEKYFNFTTTTTHEDGLINEQFDFHNYEESEFSDTFSESSFSSELRQATEVSLSHMDLEEGDPVEIASGRLEQYFLNLGVALSNDSDSVGSESESGSSVLENKKKVLKHHRRSAEYDDEHYEISEDDDCAFEQDGFDTIKKQRKIRKSQEDLLSSGSGIGGSGSYILTSPPSNSLHLGLEESDDEDERSTSQQTSPGIDHHQMLIQGSSSSSPLTSAAVLVEPDDPPLKIKRMTTVSRSNSFNWSSDEEVNLMMRSLRQLIKNMTLSKKSDEGKGEKLVYLENELIRLMKNEQNIKNIVEHMSSDSEDQSDGVYKFFETADTQPELLTKVMTHIGERLSTWMRDEEEGEDTATIKCAQSVSSDLNDDLEESDTRFSWKGSFESTLAKRQSVGSSDSLDCGPSPNDTTDLFSDRSILRSSSLHHLANSQPILEECESLTSSLSRLPHLHPNASSSSGGGGTTSIMKSKSLFLDPQVKSARYRPPGYFETMTMETHLSTPTLNHRDRRQESERKDNAKRVSVRGLIEFALQYNYKNATFEVAIKQCRDLAAVDIKKGRSDPYVKGYLLPDRTKSNKKKTKTKKNTLNPVFGETLKFQISLDELETRTLWLSVWHSDIFGKNEFLGQVMLALRGRTFDDTNFNWYSLDEQMLSGLVEAVEKNKLDLILALKWTSKGFNRDRGNLSVLIKEAKELKLIKNSLPSTFIKCSPLSDRSKKQKTSLARRTTTPVWNATMNFEGISSDGLEVALYNSDLLNHEQIGNVKLDCDSELWRNMAKREGFWVEGIVHLTTN